MGRGLLKVCKLFSCLWSLLGCLPHSRLSDQTPNSTRHMDSMQESPWVWPTPEIPTGFSSFMWFLWVLLFPISCLRLCKVGFLKMSSSCLEPGTKEPVVPSGLYKEVFTKAELCDPRKSCLLVRCDGQRGLSAKKILVSLKCPMSDLESSKPHGAR